MSFEEGVPGHRVIEPTFILGCVYVELVSDIAELDPNAGVRVLDDMWRVKKNKPRNIPNFPK